MSDLEALQQGERQQLAAIYIETLSAGHGVISRTAQSFRAADSIRGAGYRKPKVLGYVVVGRDGRMRRTSYESREVAESVVTEWNADAKSAELDWDYRVAEIVEAA